MTTFFQWRKWLPLFVPVFCVLSQAQQSRLTLEQAVQLALRHNRTLGIAGAEVNRSRQQYLATATQRLPQLSFLANGGEL